MNEMLKNDQLGDVELLTPDAAENNVLESLDSTYSTVSEMTQEERQFLNAIVLRTKPLKLVEIGVSAGASSVIILNAIKDIADARLYSIDYSDNWYRDNSLKSGHIVDKYPALKTKWELFTGALAFEFIGEKHDC
jgi:predicted O-methyltransferase YrrM